MKTPISAFIFASLVALFWGSYGPTLMKARAPMGGEVSWGPFKPYVFIGVAYVVIAVIGGAIMMKVIGDKGAPDNYNYAGSYFPAAKWGFLAGCLGAFGALCLTMAVVKSKGHPAAVMPIVFGGAVTINGIISYLGLQKGTQVDPKLWIGMALVAVGIYLTAKHTPHGPGGPKPNAPSTEATTSIDSIEPSETAVVQRSELEASGDS